MKIKRYLDRDMKHVLRKVREDQGPDAVILSNRRVDDGIEVIAAIDYDEALVRHALGVDAGSDTQINSDAFASIAEDAPVLPEEPEAKVIADDLQVRKATDSVEVAPAATLAGESNGSESTLSLESVHEELSAVRGLLETQLSGLVWKDNARKYPMRAQLLRNLARLGIAPDIANIIIDRLGPTEEITNLWKPPLTTLAQTLPVVDDKLLENGGTIALIGPTGVGKTTTIAKLAARFAMNNWADDIALVSADSYRVGAKEHLSAFANIIGAQVHAASSFDELNTTLAQLSDKKFVLIDTEGRSQRDRDLASQLAAYGRNADRVKFYLTLSAATQEAALDETVREFRKVPLEGCIVTKIDEAAQLGCVMSTLIRHDLPAAWFSDGQRIPDDLHSAAHKRLWLVNQAVDCMNASNPRVNERTMSERYTGMNVAHG